MATSTEATIASVGKPPLISRSGAGACTTACSQARQAYLGRCVTTARNCAGMTSSRSEVSSPITCMGDRQHGQLLSSGSIVTCTRGRWAGSAPRLARRFSARARAALLVLLVVGGLARGDGLLDILERQGELVRIELLGTAAELHALQLMQEMLQAIDLRQRLVARRIARRSASAREPRLQLGDFDRRLIRALAHAQEENRSARRRDKENGELSQLAAASRRSLRPWRVARVKARPVQPVDERGELRG